MTAISTTRAVERCERLAMLGPPPAWWRVFALRRWIRAYRAIMALDISVGAQMLREVYPENWVSEVANRTNNTFRGIVGSGPGAPPGRYIEAVEYMTPEEQALRMVPRSER